MEKALMSAWLVKELNYTALVSQKDACCGAVVATGKQKING